MQIYDLKREPLKKGIFGGHYFLSSCSETFNCIFRLSINLKINGHEKQEQNKKTVEAYVKAFNAGEMGKLAALFSPEAEIQGVLGKGLMDKVMLVWAQLVEGLGMQLKIEEMCAEGDIVTVRYTETGTSKGTFMGNAPTGKSYELVAMEWFVIKDALILRRWGARDGASQARQLGFSSK